MIHFIRTSRFSKVLSSYLALQLLIMTVQPMQLFAMTGGPSQPEFNSFTPIGTSDMVNLTSGDFNYNIPIMDIGGYPLNLAYNSGIMMDQEASWVGLGWNLNVGQIARSVRGIPDDFNGDKVRYENDSRDNVTLGINTHLTGAFFGADLPLSLGLGVAYNNLNGYTATPSLGVSFDIANKVDLGLNISSNIESGPTVNPSVSLSTDLKNKGNNSVYTVTNTVGLGLNSRQGIQNLNLSTSLQRVTKHQISLWGITGNSLSTSNGTSLGGGISFNDQNYTPRIRTGLQTDNFTFNVSGGTTIIGVQAQLQGTGYGSYQSVKESEKDKEVKAFGYEHTEGAHNTNLGGLLDINRENETTVNKNTNLLSVPNYTYDMYAIQGQGIGGSFRPYRGQVGYLYDMTVSNSNNSNTFGAELGVGNTTYNGFEIKLTDVDATSKKWEDKNFTLPKFTEHEDDNNDIDFERTYFKTYGSLDVDNDISLYESVQGETPVRLQIEGSKYERRLIPTFISKQTDQGVISAPIQSKIKRTERHARNQSIHSILNKDAMYDPQVAYRSEILEGEEFAFAKAHHTVGMKVMKPDGSTYVYGESAYNTKKVEATFDVSKRRNTADCGDGSVSYNPNLRSNRSAHSDGFLNKVTTPAYAHSYLLSSVLSADYEDLTGNGPTDDDLGAYTKFIYDTYDDNYKWRIPFEENKASYNEGLKSNTRDEKGNYVYGEKELKYIQKIETKTHVAIFKLSDRNDGRGVKGEHGGTASANEGRMQKLDKIYLFSKPEFTNEISSLLEDDVTLNAQDEANLMKAAIKIAHFEYEGYGENGIYNPADADNELCKGVPNASFDGGKLTLSKVYFTYRGSYMGKHTPYTFNYADFDGDGIMEANPDYNMKGYDIWGCYKPNEDISCTIASPLSTSEFPFVDQDREKADLYTRSWTLSSIDMPSGGKMEVQLEADDYQYVQQRQAMEMFKVVGAGSEPGINGEAPDEFGNNGLQTDNIAASNLYDENGHHKYLYVKLSNGEPLFDPDEGDFTAENFMDAYLKGYEDEPIFFRFLLNMKGNTSFLYDYVEGYFLIDQNHIDDINVFQDENNSATYVALPMEFLDLEGGINGNKNVNPISKAGWFFGRSYLTRLVYGDEEEVNTDNFSAIIESIGTAIDGLAEIVHGPNGVLEERAIAQRFASNKSWIRLLNPTKHKLGGGCRVTSVQLHDGWDVMTGNENSVNASNYKQFYGQEYSYNDDDGFSSGVASFEPNSSKENPYVEPFYSKSGNSYKDKITAPKESNYVEKPIGAAFFPSPTITYGKVTVTNLEREKILNEGTDEETTITLKKHATGKVVTEHFTTRDFPTISNFTELFAYKDEPTALSQLFKFSVKNHVTMSQGFVVETNDMSGKLKRQEVFAEDKENPISGVAYKYSTQPDNASRLNNTLTTIDDLGNVEEQLIGVDYEVINDFRENKTNTDVGGVNTNITTFLLGVFPGIAITPLPTIANHETQLRTATTMKHIHKTGIMTEKIAYDLGSKVSTKYLAWDADTGQALLTKTINEYDDNYFNFTYPVHWYDAYKGMGRASQNISMEGKLQSISGNNGYFNLESLTDSGNLPAQEYLIEGDEVLLYHDDDPNFTPDTYWVAGFSNGDVMLMDREGKILNECGEEEGLYTFKVTRSGFRNQQSASMASVTSMINPIDINNDGIINHLTNTSFEYATGNANNPRIINASAIEYKDFWLPQDEYRLARFYINNGAISNTQQHANPYLYNVKAEWRALKSYAYLTGRNFNTDAIATGASPRHEGFFDNFQPFYQLADSGNTWEIHPDDWTFASEVSQYSPYGAELENMDALNRFSSAQYGYNYTLPTAVASNTQYRELGFDGFEDYTYTDSSAEPLGSGAINHHFSFADTDASRVEGRSHTGRYSIVINGEGNEVTLTRPLENPTIGPRETCPVDTPPGSAPHCPGYEFENFEICNQQNQIQIPLNINNFDFGNDGPATNNPVNLTLGEVYNDAIFQNANFIIGNDGFIYSNLNITGCQISGAATLEVIITLTDTDGDSATCSARIIISNNSQDCDNCENLPSQNTSACPCDTGNGGPIGGGNGN